MSLVLPKGLWSKLFGPPKISLVLLFSMKYSILLFPIGLLDIFFPSSCLFSQHLGPLSPLNCQVFLVSKLFGPPKMSLVLQPPVAWLLILRTGDLVTELLGSVDHQGMGCRIK